jgi:hypothetical protein
MKKVLIILVAAVFSLSTFGQNPVDDVFNKYSGREGFTVVNVNGSLLKLLSKADTGDQDLQNLTASINGIKILVQEEKLNDVENFHSLIYDKLDKNIYKEMLTVKESDQDVNILVVENGDFISDFLLIVSGIDENVLISIKGKIRLEDLNRLGSSLNIEGMDKLSLMDEMNN